MASNDVRELDFNNETLEHDRVREILEEVAASTVPVRLTFRMAGIDDEAAGIVAELMGPSLQGLDLELNRITADGARKIAEGLKRAPNLELLSLEANSIEASGTEAIANELSHCPRLRELNLCNNQFGAEGMRPLAAGIAACPTLEVLNLSQNHLGSEGAELLAEGMAQCANLREIFLEFNDLEAEGARTIARGMSQCPKLEAIKLGFNELGDAGATAIGAVMAKSKLKVVNMKVNEIGDTGARAIALGMGPDLVHINLESNEICADGGEAMGNALERCSNIEHINLENNKFGSLGAQAIGKSLSQCSRLEYLNLENNGVDSEGAKSVCNGAAAGCPSLKTLILSNNGIGSLPRSVCMLPLQRLLITGISARSLPPGFLRLRQTLKVIRCGGNPWATPPQEVMGTNDLAKIFAFVEALERDGGAVCRQSRLLLVGLGEAGKTSLQRALLSETDATARIAADDRTVGIDITAWRPNPKDEFEYRVWDFAGQRTYYGTHQFFLSTRVQYVLVWSLAAVASGKRDLRGGIQEWLDALAARVPGASVVLVATHADEVDADKAQELVLQTQAFVSDYVAARGSDLKIAQDGKSFVVSCTTGAGIGAARAAIVAAGQALPHVGEQIPASWVAVRDALRTLNDTRRKAPPLATMEQVVSSCAKAGLDAHTVDEAVTLWHELGEVFAHSGLVVLRPQWIVDVLKTLVTHEMSSDVRDAHPDEVAALEHKGRLSWALAQELLSELVGKRAHMALLGILAAFDVVIKVVTDGAPEWIVPTLLPAGEWDPAAETDWPLWADGETKGHSGRAAYRFMPAGLFHRLCVRAHAALEWEVEDYHATFARFRSADGTRCFVELGEDGDGQQLVTVHGRGTQSWAVTQAVLKAARALNEFFRGAQCVLTRVGDAGGDSVRWDRLTEDRFRIEVEADMAALPSAAAAPAGTGKPVMLSYKHREREGELALQIRKGLEDGGTPVWIDVDGITGGSTWRQKIAEGIQGARVIVFALSGRSVVSPFCEEEICLATRLGKPVIPALVSAAPSRADYRAQMLQLRDTQWIDFHGQDFDTALKELQTRVAEKLGTAPATGSKTRASGTRVTVPPCPPEQGTSSDDSDADGRVFIAHSPSAEDTAAAEAIRDWITARAGLAACSVLAPGELAVSPLRKQDLAASQVVIAVMSQAYISDEACWKELSDWDEARGTPGTAALVPVYIEDLGAGWTGSPHTQALELVVSRHNGLSTDLVKAGTDRCDSAMAALCDKVRRLIHEHKDKKADADGASAGGPHATGTSTSAEVKELRAKLAAAEERAAAAEERAASPRAPTKKKKKCTIQ